MLTEISIRNFAIIEEVTVPFDDGLTVLTGETGAGKSIIIDAIGLLIGGRGSSEYVRHGTDRAEIEGLFYIPENHPVIEKAQGLGIEVSDGMVVLKRDMTSSGKSICRVNGKLVTLAILREVGQSLIDIHGQHEHQFLLQSDKHLSLLDQYNSGDMKRTIQEYQQLYKRYIEVQKQLRNLTENEQEMVHRIDLIQYQLEEIEQANLQPKEDEELQEEKQRLSNFERLYQSVTDAYQALYGEQKGIDVLGLAMSHLEDVSDYDPELKPIQEAVTNAYYTLEDSAHQLRNYVESMEFDPGRLDVIEERLHEINSLKRKYGNSVEEILEYSSRIEEELDTFTNKDDRIRQLEEELKEIGKDLYLEAKQLSTLRKKAAERLEKKIHQQLKDLYMEKTTFKVSFELVSGASNVSADIDGNKISFSKSGMDEVEFLISTNPGEPLKPLVKIASGGELSRIILALKAIFSNQQEVASIIFDEVDTGVSGRVAQAIAEKIQKLSTGSQVLCITHLPQVAAMADRHLYIKKSIKGNRTLTIVKPLSFDQKVKEIARMISGVEVTDLTKRHAKEMIQFADEAKITS
ncbi:DNA repair protein RecN [Pseudalkalibacillus salsuginis]|uniref:DNA repair protein RecN n=1 Tax=Pseudalkalibacillus salsuginis TaxID=2910972 RepID=UPI001EFF92C5|nr:DNA repair protein RecN [Pseudalkalibacillus salsuginis]MCF6408388.1 DNA repair protein RecN [Pseudalkalibacillus salsuginis]